MLSLILLRWLNNVCIKDKTFDIKSINISFINETTKKDLKVGETIINSNTEVTVDANYITSVYCSFED